MSLFSITNTLNHSFIIDSFINIDGKKIPVKTEINLDGLDGDTIGSVLSVAERHFNKDLNIITGK